MKVLILGADGYLGWALCQYLTMGNHDVIGCDNQLRRHLVDEEESQSAIPIAKLEDRLEAFKEVYGKELPFFQIDLQNTEDVDDMLKTMPEVDCIVHLGEIPSAPYSMRGAEEATFTQSNNIIGNLNILYAMKKYCPDAHLLKLGTMGEYGTPNLDIPEGSFEIEYRGRKDTLMFPRQAGSWYHQSKVHDTNNIIMACRIWGLRSTDIMQGVVFGSKIDGMEKDDRLLTRLDFDQSFGTLINRFCCQIVINEPLTIYGKGFQKRGYLPLKDSMQCLTIAIENPPKAGEYRVFNQFQEVYDVTDLANKVRNVGLKLGLEANIQNFENPRKESEEHYYNPDHQKLLDLGYKPTIDIEDEIKKMLKDLLRYQDRIIEKKNVLIPDIRWDGTKRKSEIL